LPGFSKRHINRQSLRIFRATGRQMAMYVRKDAFNPQVTVPARVPTDITAAAEVPGAVDHTLVYIFAYFDSDDQQAMESAGSTSFITGTLTIPRMYKTLLDKAEYFDPFLNGSRFEKAGASPDAEGLFVFQKIKSVVNPTMGEVSM
jgi:hypothetical protein